MNLRYQVRERLDLIYFTPALGHWWTDSRFDSVFLLFGAGIIDNIEDALRHD